MQDETGVRLDLNLLVVFDAVMTDGSLTKAGERLGMTQSAVSRALMRLRDATGGPALFERTGRGMRPTPAAHAMYAKVREALDMLRASVRAPGATFCANRDERTFVLGLPFGFDSLIVPALIRRLGPYAKPTFRISGDRAGSLLAELRVGSTVLAFDHEVPEQQGFHAELLFMDPFVMIARPDHPTLKAPFSMNMMQALVHVGLTWDSSHGPSPLTERMGALGISRRIAYSTPCFSAITAVVETSDMVGMLPERLARQFTRWYDVELHPVPDDIKPMPVYMVWHESFDDDSGHIWLRHVMREVCEEL